METHRVTMVNREGPPLEIREDHTILEAAEAQGLRLPAGCREGHCISCAARLLEGRVEQPGAVALTASERADGFVLLCVARPRSDCTVRVGAEARRPLFVNPLREGAG